MIPDGMIPDGMIPDGMIPDGMIPDGMGWGRGTEKEGAAEAKELHDALLELEFCAGLGHGLCAHQPAVVQQLQAAGLEQVLEVADGKEARERAAADGVPQHVQQRGRRPRHGRAALADGLHDVAEGDQAHLVLHDIARARVHELDTALGEHVLASHRLVGLHGHGQDHLRPRIAQLGDTLSRRNNIQSSRPPRTYIVLQ